MEDSTSPIALRASSSPQLPQSIHHLVAQRTFCTSAALKQTLGFKGRSRVGWTACRFDRRPQYPGRVFGLPGFEQTRRLGQGRHQRVRGLITQGSAPAATAWGNGAAAELCATASLKASTMGRKARSASAACGADVLPQAMTSRPTTKLYTASS